MTSFAVTCLVTILFALLTYSMAFRAGTPFVGGLDRMFLWDILSDIGKGGIGNPNPLAATIPESVYICFQMTFAIITPALIAGAFAERMKFSAMLWFIGLWAIFVYAISRISSQSVSDRRRLKIGRCLAIGKAICCPGRTTATSRPWSSVIRVT
jgi:ammonia channel protein AmtB